MEYTKMTIGRFCWLLVEQYSESSFVKRRIALSEQTRFSRMDFEREDKTRQDKTRPDQTRPDKTRQENLEKRNDPSCYNTTAGLLFLCLVATEWS
mmetsp:Transcript_4830/g.13972  ORF Transcript_4830/g.13972 Transcript_4830/m.13972 type:complete len:95 (-) Transcript_4830:285-569(-)